MIKIELPSSSHLVKQENSDLCDTKALLGPRYVGVDSKKQDRA